MAETKTARKGTRSNGFTAEERAAMKERSRELKAAGRGKKGTEKATCSPRSPRCRGRTGMPAYAKDDKVLCYFKPAEKFKTRYATLGFSDKANLDEGAMWPVEFALTSWTGTEEKRISELVKRAMS
jgi:hypothetical protein